MLKLVSAIFYQVFIFAANDISLKIMKMFFISSKKLFSFQASFIFDNFVH